MIKGVIFDIDGVLLDSKKANAIFYQRLIEKAGYEKPSEEVLFSHFHLSLVDTIKALIKGISDGEIKKIRSIASGDLYPDELLKIPQDAKNVLRLLSKKYKIAIVTSRAEMGVEIFLKTFGEKDLFTTIVHFGEYLKPKPDPEPILLAADRLKVRPDEILYVGDSLTDLQAAKSAGAWFVDFSTNNIPVEGSSCHIDSLSELPGLINRL